MVKELCIWSSREKKFKVKFGFKIYNIEMEKDDLSQLQRSRLLPIKYSEIKEMVWESPVAPNRNQDVSHMLMEMVMQQNLVESVYKT